MKLASVPAPIRQGGLLVFLLLGMAAAVPGAQAREEWFRGLDLEDALARADLVLVVKVAEVSETKIVYGGKSERTDQQFTFQPLRTIKGVFARQELLLTTQDLGNFDDRAQLERGQVRLLLLGRSRSGYSNVNNGANLDQALPRLRGEDDPLLATVKTLIDVTHEHDRSSKVALLLGGLRTASGPSAVALLNALQRRALLAAQASGAAAAITRHLGDPSAAVREAAVIALHALLQADYLNQASLREAAVIALAGALEKTDADLSLRVNALEALGSAGALVLKNDAATQQLRLDRVCDTFAERAALLRGIGQLKMSAQRQAVVTFLEQLPLDASFELQMAAGLALARLDAEQALKLFLARLKKKYAAGLDLSTEITLLGELPAASAVPALLEVVKLELKHDEKMTLALVSRKLADPRLVPLLTGMLDMRRPDLRWQAIEALMKINTPAAARAVQSHLKEEDNLLRKLEIATFLGRHGIRDGYPYAIEHMSESQLVEQAVAALAAIRDPRTVEVLRDILKTSNDTTWNSVVIRALGALKEQEFAGQFLEIAQDLKRPLAPPALIALGDLGEVKALPKVREGLASRNDQVALASVRAAARLLAVPDVKADELRDQLAALLADADALQVLRLAALNALAAVKDPRLDKALVAVEKDAALEGSSLLQRAEALLRERQVKLP